MLDVEFTLKIKLIIYMLALTLYVDKCRCYVNDSKHINFGLCAMLLQAAEETVGDVFDGNYNNVIEHLPEFRDCKPKGVNDDVPWYPETAFDVRIEILNKCINNINCQL